MNQIHDLVVERTEKLLDKEIQQLYAPDAAQFYTKEAARKIYNPRKSKS